MKVEQLGMVLEGGGIRGIYTAGILDYFLLRGVNVGAIFGVSAGSIHGLNYVAKQRGRSYNISTKYLKDKRYLSLQSLVKTGDIFGVDFCYHTLPDQLEPFDYDTFRKNPCKLYATVSNLETGQAEYILVNNLKEEIDYIRASASLPLVSRIVEIDGNKYLDGGITDSIPLRAAKKHGYAKNIVILTRIEGYKKKPNKLIRVIRKKYKQYPQFVAAAYHRHQVYNKELEYVKKDQQQGNAFVFYPSKCIDVGRLEKDETKIKALYRLGYEDAKANYDALMQFVGQ